jgi:hypothetical protein
MEGHHHIVLSLEDISTSTVHAAIPLIPKQRFSAAEVVRCTEKH